MKVKLNSFLKDSQIAKLFLIILIGVVIRVVLTNVIYSNDAESFIFWGNYLKDNSISSLYEFLPGGFTPLPPLYYYLTRYLAQIVSFLNLWQNQWATYFIFKIPIYVSEIIAAILIYSFTKKYISKKLAIFSSAFYFLNPAIIYNSAIWGEIDSFISVLAFAALLLFIGGKYFWALLLYSAGVLSKLQDLAMLPLVIYLSFVNLWFKKLFINLTIIAILALILFLPIIADKGIIWTAKYFYQLPNWYPYTSIYAYNLWAPTGFLTPDKTFFLSLISYKFLGLAFYWLIAILILLPLTKKANRNPLTILFAAFLLFFDFGFFSTRIHSRYLIYSLPFASPLLALLPLEITIFTIFVILDQMLPFHFSQTRYIVEILNDKYVILAFTTLGLALFIDFYSKYKRMVEKKIK